jgi:7,8-dihydroneopterin aldolase/epimerase/oxygenase
MTSVLQILDIECHAYHGCLPEETAIGGRFSVDVKLDIDLAAAVESDQLQHTADYVLIHQIVKDEMQIPSKLIEHAAGRILKKIHAHYPAAFNITVTLRKFNPPVNGAAGTAVIVLSLN